jgi:hypothetical protein
MDNKSIKWRELVVKVKSMNEHELKAALNFELVTENRANIVLRLHQRYTKVRMFRERESIGKGELL